MISQPFLYKIWLGCAVNNSGSIDINVNAPDGFAVYKSQGHEMFCHDAEVIIQTLVRSNLGRIIILYKSDWCKKYNYTCVHKIQKIIFGIYLQVCFVRISPHLPEELAETNRYVRTCRENNDLVTQCCPDEITKIKKVLSADWVQSFPAY